MWEKLSGGGGSKKSKILNQICSSYETLRECNAT